MKAIIFLSLIVLMSSCSHWKWVAKHQNEVCAKCPTNEITTNTETDTTYWSIVPADTLYIEGLDFPTDPEKVLIDNVNYKIIREKGKTIVITKEKKVPFVVTRYRNIIDTNKIIKVKEQVFFWWGYALIFIALIVGYFFRKLIE